MRDYEKMILIDASYKDNTIHKDALLMKELILKNINK
jgi:hypothetical protein